MSPRLQVEGSLSFSVQDGGDSTAGTVTGDGSTITVRADHPAVALRDLMAAGSGPLLSNGLQQLSDDGLTVVLTGPRGELARAGAGVDSAWGRLLAGSRRVQPGRPRAFAPLARARLAGAVPPGVRWLVLLVAAAAGIRSVVHRREAGGLAPSPERTGQDVGL